MEFFLSKFMDSENNETCTCDLGTHAWVINSKTKEREWLTQKSG